MNIGESCSIKCTSIPHGSPRSDACGLLQHSYVLAWLGLIVEFSQTHLTQQLCVCSCHSLLLCACMHVCLCMYM